MAIDDHVNTDPLTGVTDPLKHMQIKALITEEKRKQELHDLEVRQRKAQITGTAGPSPSAPADDLGESLLSLSSGSKSSRSPQSQKNTSLRSHGTPLTPGTSLA